MLRESFDTLRTTLIRGRGRPIAPGGAGDQCFERRGQDDTGHSIGVQLCSRRSPHVAGRLRPAASGRPSHLRTAPRGRFGRTCCDRNRRSPTPSAPTLTPNLWVLPAGRCDQQSLSALAQRQMFLGECFQKMRDDFEFVIVDCCPVLPVVDSMLIGQHVDIAVLSVLRDVSQVPRVDEANRRLTIDGHPCLWGCRYRSGRRQLLPPRVSRRGERLKGLGSRRNGIQRISEHRAYWGTANGAINLQLRHAPC